MLNSRRFVRTGMNEAIAERVIAKGVVFADIQDCAEAMMKLVSDDSINGKTIPIISPAKITEPRKGKNLAIVPRTWAKRGYMDLNMDDDEKGTLLDEMQQIVLKTSHRLENCPGGKEGFIEIISILQQNGEAWLLMPEINRLLCT